MVQQRAERKRVRKLSLALCLKAFRLSFGTTRSDWQVVVAEGGVYVCQINSVKCDQSVGLFFEQSSLVEVVNILDTNYNEKKVCVQIRVCCLKGQITKIVAALYEHVGTLLVYSFRS